jgi:hypothetical protein
MLGLWRTVSLAVAAVKWRGYSLRRVGDVYASLLGFKEIVGRLWKHRGRECASSIKHVAVYNLAWNWIGLMRD